MNSKSKMHFNCFSVKIGNLIIFSFKNVLMYKKDFLNESLIKILTKS